MENPLLRGTAKSHVADSCPARGSATAVRMHVLMKIAKRIGNQTATGSCSKPDGFFGSNPSTNPDRISAMSWIAQGSEKRRKIASGQGEIILRQKTRRSRQIFFGRLLFMMVTVLEV
jgi:hypothetical protein